VVPVLFGTGWRGAGPLVVPIGRPGPGRVGFATWAGAALALLPADRVLAAQYAWPAPLAPEGASAIVYRDTGHAPEPAARQRIRSAGLAADGILDRVIAEMPRAPTGSAATSGTRCTGCPRTW
jgi:hypothetical protein